MEAERGRARSRRRRQQRQHQQRRGETDAKVEVQRLVLHWSFATRGFGLEVLLPLGPLSRAARHDEDARESAAGRALRVLRAAPTKDSSPAARRLCCVGAEGSFFAPLSGPQASWRLFSGLGRAEVKPGVGVAATAAVLSREAAAAAKPAACAPAPARRFSPRAAHCARRPTSRCRRRLRTPLGLCERDQGEPLLRPPPLSPRSPHALPGCAARSPLLSPPAAAAARPRPRLSPSLCLPARVVANRRRLSCSGNRPDPRQPPAPALPKRPVFCCSPRGVAGGKPRVHRAPLGQVEGLREIK
ncbi:proline-rich protein 36-like [Pteropus medius]|uniref:proline-rich protein 36-like n=1 Tax=Pteropus vampyrus TaxID=132908 RepID=UPI00196A80AE|nr:proline-rich protein 36-like [Pteropus giganteus]